MIVVFGAIAQDMHFAVPQLPFKNETIKTHYFQCEPGGKAANQAVAAARFGGKVMLYGKIGGDENGTNISSTLKDAHVDVSNVRKSEKNTGIKCYIQDNDGLHNTIAVMGANEDLQSSDLPDDALDDKTVLLLQTEIDAGINYEVLQRAKEKGATTIMNLAPAIDMSQKTLNLLDYLIVNQDEARKVATQLSLTVEDNAIKIAQGLAQQGKLNCIITVGGQGAVAVTDDGKGWSAGALNIGEIVDKSGAEDVYCGTLAASLEAGLHLPRAMKRASVAGTLACTQRGIQSSFAGDKDIDARINDLDDPQAVEL